MQVYKVLFKVIQKNLGQLVIYVVVFLMMTILLASTYTNPGKVDFTETKTNIAFINEDTDSVLIKGFKDYLSQYANFVTITDDKQLKDALFFREIEYIVRIPDGFTEGFLTGNNVQIEKTSVPGATSSIFMDRVLNKYFDTANIYLNSGVSMTDEQLAASIEKDLSIKTDVTLENSGMQKNNNEKCNYYFNFLSYSLFTILILGVTAVMIVFHNTDLRRRNTCSPMKLKSMNTQILLGNLSFGILAWFIMISASFIMYGSYMFTGKGLLFLLNSLVFTLSALSISYLISNFVKDRNAMSAVSNVVALGTCFIGGAFVPQELLGKSVLKIASFTPTYWFIKSNNAITDLANYDFETLRPLFINMTIMIGFAIAFLTIALVVNKQRRVSA